MRSNPRMRDILRATDVTGLSDRDIPLPFHEVVERGWSVTAAGRRVLAALRAEVTARHLLGRLAERVPVNGRGMSDADAAWFYAQVRPGDPFEITGKDTPRAWSTPGTASARGTSRGPSGSGGARCAERWGGVEWGGGGGVGWGGVVGGKSEEG